MPYEVTNTHTGKTYRIRTRTAGVRFATVGQVVAQNGRVVAETDPYPYGFDGPAAAKARELAEGLK